MLHNNLYDKYIKDDQDTVKSKVPEFNPEILTEKAVTTLNKTTGRYICFIFFYLINLFSI